MRKIQETTPNHPEHPEMELKEKINYCVLRGIFEEIFTRCRIKGDINFLPIDKISTVIKDESLAKRNFFAAYHTEANEIIIQADEIVQRAEKLRIDPEIILAYTLGHEEAHAVGHTECNIKRVGNWVIFYNGLAKSDNPLRYNWWYNNHLCAKHSPPTKKLKLPPRY